MFTPSKEKLTVIQTVNSRLSACIFLTDAAVPCHGVILARQLQHTLNGVDRQHDWFRLQSGPRNVDL